MANNKLPSSHRLLKSSEFDAVFKQSDVRVSKPALLLLAMRNRRGFNRLGMVISKKNVAGAVDRNRIKRQIRDVFRRLPEVDNNTGLDVVVLSRHSTASEPSLTSVIDQSFTQLLEKNREILQP
jgi:ribonuclease P protein component